MNQTPEKIACSDIRNRLRELQGEYQHGESQLAELNQRRTEVRDTLLRISGAIQVLEELLAAESDAAAQTPTNTTLTQVAAA